ncbi:MAG: sensor histidine kinase [Marivirga sp.]|nr:sensor histidine kinase [Marivirga sp.]
MGNLSTKLKIILFFLAGGLLLILIEAYALIDTFNFSWKVALADAVNMNLLIATVGYIMFTSMRYYQPSPKNAFFLFVKTIVLAFICTVAHRYLMMWNIFPQEDEYHTYLYSSQFIRGLLIWFMITLIAAVCWIWFYMQDQRDVEKRQHDTIKLAREAELASLRQQLQPHFLFNSLNSISALAGSKPEEARKMIQQLSDFLRGTIKKDDQQLVSLQEELKHLQLYLDIEKVRFGHRLKTQVDESEQTNPMLLPSLLLQPLVENAIKFGLYDTIGEIVIRISTLIRDQQLIIRIENPFDPSTAQPKPGTGFGLNSVQRRLYLLYARNDLLSTNQVENIFITEVKIPQPA